MAAHYSGYHQTRCYLPTRKLNATLPRYVAAALVITWHFSVALKHCSYFFSGTRFAYTVALIVVPVHLVSPPASLSTCGPLVNSQRSPLDSLGVLVTYEGLGQT